MIQHVDQYEFCFKALQQAFESEYKVPDNDNSKRIQSQPIPPHPTQENTSPKAHYAKFDYMSQLAKVQKKDH